MAETAETKPNGTYLLTEPSRFRLSLLSAFVLIFGVACLIAYNSYNNAVHHSIRQNETRAELLGKIVLEHHRAAIGIVQSYASRPLLVDAVKKKDFKAALSHLTALSKANPEIKTSWISNPDSTAWVNFPVDERGFGKDLSQREWYKGVSKEWKPYVSDIYKLFTQEENLAVSLCVPIFYDENGKVIGVLGASLTTGFYNDLVRQLSFDMEADITLVDRKGHIIYSDRYPDKKEVIPYPLFDTVTRVMKEKNGTIEVRDTSDGSRVKYLSFVPVEDIGWSIVVEKPRSAVFSSVFGALIQIAIISFLTFLVAVFFVVNSRRKQRLLATVREEKERLSALINNIQDEVWFADTQKRFTLANPSALREFGLGNGYGIDVEQFAGGLEVYRPDGTARAVDETPPLRALRGEVLRSEEEIVRNPGSGELRYREVSASPMKRAGGTIIGSVSVVRDITERKRAELALQASEERWATTLASIGDAVIATDTSGSIMFMNAVAEALTGWTFGDASQKPITEVFHIINEQTRLEVENPITKVLREGMIVGLANHTLLVKKDGTEVPIDDSGAPIRDKEGKTTGVVLVFRDITDRKQAEKELQREMSERERLEDQLRQSQKMEAIGTLAGGIAHDFNNILAAILGFTEMAADDVTDRPEVGSNLQKVLKSAMRARELVKQILAFSRKTKYERTPLSLTAVINETVQLLRASIPATVEIRLTNTASSDHILAAPVEVQQILMNLATNASLAMQDKGGTLEISLTDIDFKPDAPVMEPDVMPGEYLQLMVKDTGVGMSPEVMKRVFEPFFTTREVGKGTGMGLAVVYGIVNDLQGTITVESAPGLGSTFRVLLPKIKTAIEKEQVPAVAASRGTERILFVDDEQMLLEWGQATLERLGYSVVALTDSTEALRTFSSDPSRFDLVITDQTMSGMTGMQLAKELLTIRPDIPIILCTGHSEAVSPETAKDGGIRQFLMKPVATQELAQAIRRVLDTNAEG